MATFEPLLSRIFLVRVLIKGTMIKIRNKLIRIAWELSRRFAALSQLARAVKNQEKPLGLGYL